MRPLDGANEMLRREREATPRRELEQLARDLFVADTAGDKTLDAVQAFDLAAEFLAVRDARRSERK